jgi:hypothetical protein
MSSSWLMSLPCLWLGCWLALHSLVGPPAMLAYAWCWSINYSTGKEMRAGIEAEDDRWPAAAAINWSSPVNWLFYGQMVFPLNRNSSNVPKVFSQLEKGE